MTTTQHGMFIRHLRQINHASRQMCITHSGTYSVRYCDKRRFKKWNNVRKKLERNKLKFV